MTYEFPVRSLICLFVLTAIAAPAPGVWPAPVEAFGADELLKTGEVTLLLTDAIKQPSSGGSMVVADVELLLDLHNGKLDDEVWGHSLFYEKRFAIRRAYNKAVYTGWIESEQAAGDRIQLDVPMLIARDMWGTAGFKARYQIELVRKGNTLEGSYSGTSGDKPVAGKVHGTVTPRWSAPVAGFEPLAEQEHPRLAFRASEIPELRRRTQTPEGKAIIAQLKKRLADRIDGENAGFHAAGHALLYVLYEDDAEADKAREIVERIIGPGIAKAGSGGNLWRSRYKRIIRTPPAVGVALAYDLCYHAWSEDFRTLVTAELENQAFRLIEGRGGRHEYNDNYPSNHVGICNGGGGVVAMAILGEPGEHDPKPGDPGSHAADPIEAPTDFKPGKGVPIVEIESGKMPTRWLHAGPLKPESLEIDFLATIGGCRNARPEVGTKITYEGRSVEFKVHDQQYIWNTKHSGFVDALNLVGPIDRDYHSTVFYYTVLENDRERLLRYVCEHRGTRAWLAGTEIVHDSFLQLGKGYFPLLLQVRVGSTDPWGIIWTIPHFVETTDEQLAAARGEYCEDLAQWQKGYDRWVASGKVLQSAPRLLRTAAWNMRRHLEYGHGDHGWYNEGDDYLRYAATQGVLPFLVAYRNVVGEDFGSAHGGQRWHLPLLVARGVNNDGRWLLPYHAPYAGQWTTNFYRSGDWVMGFDLVPEEYMPSVRYTFDRLHGHEGGDGTFDIYNPHQAIYALAHYPFDVEPKNPDGVIPRVIEDRAKGYYVFRDGFSGRDDFVATIYAKNEPTGGGWSFADASSFRIIGLGTEWARHRAVKDKDGSQENENVVVVPGTNGWLGAHPTFFSSSEDGSGVVSMNTDDVYLGKLDKNAGPGGGKVVGEKYVDLGIRGMRSFAVDYSGTSGAPALFAVVDRITGGKEEPVWRMHTGAKSIKVAGTTFTLTADDGATMAGTFVAPAGVKIKTEGANLVATGGQEFFVVMTMQRGDAPEVRTTGTGLNSRARVGSQQASFDGETIRIGN